MGYTGGSAPNPTYKSVCDGDGHTEAVRLVYDPSVITYQQLIARVLHEASPNAEMKAQYKTAVWANSPEQADIAASIAKRQAKSDVPILLSSSTRWHDAEEYHQKYVQKMQSRAGQDC